MRVAKAVGVSDLGLVLLVGLTTGGCIGTARVWYQDSAGGILALQGEESRAMEDANRQMAAHCGPGNYVIVRRETVVTGQESYNNSQYGQQQQSQAQVVQAGQTTTQGAYGSQTGTYPAPGAPGAVTTTQGGGYQQTSGASQTNAQGQTYTQGGASSVAGVRDVTQERVHYQCRRGQSAAVIPAPGAAYPPGGPAMAPGPYTVTPPASAPTP